MPVCRNWLLISVCVLTPVSPLAASEPNERALLDEVRDRHRAARDAIRTVSYTERYYTLKWEALRYKYEDDRMPPVGMGHVSFATGPTQFWRTPDAWRQRTLMSDMAMFDQLSRFGYLLNVSMPAEPSDYQKPTVSAHWRCMSDPIGPLFDYTSRDGGSLPFHALLGQPHEIISIRRLPTQPGEAAEIHVVLKHDSSVNEFWFSPNHNYLIRKHTEYPHDQSHHHHEHEVTAFAEPKPGQFYPARVEHRSFENGELKEHRVTVLSEIRVNEPIPQEAFRIPGLEGQWCDDHDCNVRYRVDADGFRTGSAQPIPNPVPVPEPSLVKPGVSKPPPARDESGSPTVWLGTAIAVLAVLLCTAVFEIRRLRGQLRKHTAPQ